MNVSREAAEVFLEAQSVGLEVREQFVEDACGKDTTLLEEVLSLLEAARESENFFDKIADKVGLSALAAAQGPLRDNKVIGQWRLLRVIGRGGMGTVYLAERADGQFDQQAAFKLLPFGLDGQAARLRFLAERQILAQLSHDGIARLIDGGVTDEGAPYFVMDYVDGRPIDVYCDEKQLDVDQRIRLFLSVLAAISHAHAHLIVHRDIKPSNVLVTEDGSPKLLDFGIAKVLSREGGGDTREFGVALTPEFAAPEQFVGGSITTATDVYSLGLLLYSLLAGRNPRGTADPGSPAALQALATQDLPRLSDFATDDSRIGIDKVVDIARQRRTSLAGLKRSLRGDLDNIFQKALHFEADERYSGVDDFATDLRRYLDDEPVTARPITVFYRVNKFIRRHSGGVLAALLALLALMASTAITAWQMVEAQQQRDLAMSQQQRVRATNEFYGLLLEEMGPAVFSTVDLLDRGRELLEKQFGVEEAFMGPLLFDVSMRYGGLGERAKQEALLLQAESVAREYEDDDLLATVLCKLHDVYARGDPARARLYAEQGIRVYERIDRPEIRASLECLRMQSRLAQTEGDIEAALGHLTIAEETLDAYPLSTASLRGPLLGHMAYTYYNAGRIDQSIAYLDKTLDLLDKSGRGNSVGYVRVASNKAVALQSVGRLAEAVAAFENLIERMRQSGYEQRGLAPLLSQYGTALVRVGRLDAAEKAYRESLAIARGTGNEEEVAAIHMGLSNVYGAREEFDRALESLDAAWQYYSRDESADPVQGRMVRVLRIKTLRNMGRVGEAAAAADALLKEVGYPQVERGPALLSVLIQAAEAQRAAGNFGFAEELATDLIARLDATSVGNPEDNVEVGRAYVQRAEIRLDAGDATGARRDLERAIPIIEQGLGEAHDESREARELLNNL